MFFNPELHQYYKLVNYVIKKKTNVINLKLNVYKHESSLFNVFYF